MQQHVDAGRGLQRSRRTCSRRNPDVTIIFGQADALALGAAQAVKVANLGEKIWVVGFDGDVAGLEALSQGVLDATMTQRTPAAWAASR